MLQSTYICALFTTIKEQTSKVDNVLICPDEQPITLVIISDCSQRLKDQHFFSPGHLSIFLACGLVSLIKSAEVSLKEYWTCS